MFATHGSTQMNQLKLPVSIELLQTLIHFARFTLRVDDRQTIAVPKCLLIYDVRKFLATLAFL